jgi:hypothetical protein
LFLLPVFVLGASIGFPIEFIVATSYKVNKGGTSMKRHQFSRRDFLRISAVAASGPLLMACAQQAAPGEAPAAPQQQAQAAEPAQSGGTYNEAPMLAERVRAGDLPPVDERLPVNPVVVANREAIGQYGGADLLRPGSSDA